ncbi:MAG: hypothetical protein OEV36_05905 [Myxococcales bacterium]|nr:hypothetical protein [Myxococcales bacterium]
MAKLSTCGVVVVLIGCAHTPKASPSQSGHATARYTVTIFDNWGGARARVCLEGGVARELVPIDGNGSNGLRGAWIESDPLEIQHGRIALPPSGPARCIDYETRFEGPTFRDSDAVVVSQSKWLWRPDPMPPGLEASVRFVLPAGAKVSLPWPQSESVYFLHESAFLTSAYGVFGNFDRQGFAVAGTRIEVARLGELPPGEDVRRWLGRAVQATASLGGRFPSERLHVVVIPVPAPHERVVFGMLRRGGGPSVLLFPSLYATVDELEADWVAVHELSHLWLPRLYPEDRWLSEGIATYLQEVLRARCGLQSSESAWQHLRDGFERGERAGTGRNLVSESRDMNRTGAYYRVYWSGAAFALQADLQLRKSTNGTMTLLRALNDAQDRWGSQIWPVDASVVLRALADASGEDFFGKLAETYAASSDFLRPMGLDSPEYEQAQAEIMFRRAGMCGVSAESSR